MHFLITGHTGFKGAWLTALLKERGHRVSGVSLSPQENSLFKTGSIENFLENDIICDIRNLAQLKTVFKGIDPDVVIHLAAQSLVRESYIKPTETFETNAIGTINVLNASQSLDGLQAQLIITTDKVYKNINSSNAFIETDPLGGSDPYSASKAMADIATQSWITSFIGVPTAIARAGNVIGGGDVCKDRLIPDLVGSFKIGVRPKIRAPKSIRPWQHVLDCLNGYLLLVDALLENSGREAWNFGPDESKVQNVSEVVRKASEIWGIAPEWDLDDQDGPPEASTLILNSEKARLKLGWNEKLNFTESLEWTVNWYKNVFEGSSPLKETLRNIHDFENR